MCSSDLMLHVEEKAIALLLAVVQHIDARVDLARHRIQHGGMTLRGEQCFVDTLAPGPLRIELDERGGAGQAAGVRGQDSFRAFLHDEDDASRPLDQRGAEKIAGLVTEYSAGAGGTGWVFARARRLSTFVASLSMRHFRIVLRADPPCGGSVGVPFFRD